MFRIDLFAAERRDGGEEQEDGERELGMILSQYRNCKKLLVYNVWLVLSLNN
jgi:hypothetical protein